jgi:catecholate siderophore receptor
VEPPPPGTPYADIAVSRDQPSSAGTTSLAINRMDLTSKFDVGQFKNALTGGLELSKEQSHVTRFENGLDDIPPTPLLTPNGFGTPPTPLIPYSAPKGEGKDVSVYALDSLALGPQWDVDLGVRWDRFKTNFTEAYSGTAFERTYGTSYNPAIEYLIIAPSNDSLSPEKNSAVEVGAKVKVLDGKAELTGALFDTLVKNVRNSDPDDPTIQDAPFEQRVKGVEVGLDGYVTSIWKMTASYTHLDDKITATTDPLSLGKIAPNTPNNGANFWTVVEPVKEFYLGGGATYVSHRFADTENTAGVPSYVMFNAMMSYEFNEHFKVQLNLNNVANKLYFTGVYYSGVDENHAIPNPGRTVIGTASYRF